MTAKLPIEKVLLVDDESEYIETVSERLLTRGIHSTVALNGDEALMMIEAAPPEVIVLDLKMPGMDGLEVLRRVKEKHPAIEVIMLTGHGSAKEEDLAKDLGALAYLNKPQNIDVLARTIRQAYDKKNRQSSIGNTKVVDEASIT